MLASAKYMRGWTSHCRKIGALAGVALLAGCQVTTDATPLQTGASGKPTMSFNEMKASTAHKRLMAQSDVDIFASMGVGGHIVKRCPKVVSNRMIGPTIKAQLNRATVFAGKAKVTAAYDRAKAAFQAKYGKPLESNSNHCDAAARELREQTAVSAFFLDNGL